MTLIRADIADTLDKALAYVPALCDATGEIIRRYFRSPIEVIDKADASPVTLADREAETALRQLIAAQFPGHGVIGEEFGSERPDAEFVWVLDPIDGTKSFIAGVPLFGTLIGLMHHGKPIMGVLDQPISRERWIGAADAVSTHNGRPLQTRHCTDIGAATIFTTAPELFDGDEIGRFSKVQRGVKLMRYGADCYAYGLVALGFVDSVIEAGLKPHDFCALVPIVEGAGGVVTGWHGEAAETSPHGRILASGDRHLHDKLLTLIA